MSQHGCSGKAHAIIAPVLTYVSVDIGGTQMRAAAYPADGLQPLRLEKAPTQGPGPVYARLERLIDSIWPADGQVAAIGVACPGPLDPRSGLVIASPNIPEWQRFPLGDKLRARFAAPLAVGNDANLAGLGEWQYGAGRGHQDVLYLTVSTGIGGGVISAGRMLEGAHGLAAELGHVTVLPGGPRCGCGQDGHIEALASGPAIARYVREQQAMGAGTSLPPDGELSARRVAEAAAAGDALARAAFERAGHFLGIAIASYLHMFDPSIVILGGGVSQSGALLLDPLLGSLRQHVMDPAYLDGVTVTAAALGDDAGLLGALALARLSIASTQ